MSVANSEVVKNTTSNRVEKNNSTQNLPKEHMPCSVSRPDYMQAVAKLFGLSTPNLENASILEIGCGFGGNIIPLAEFYSKSKFVAFDESNEYINFGKELTQSMNIKNVTLKKMSVLDVDEKLGKFDYIICHNQFSIASANSRQKIFEICRNNLTKNGVAFISFDTAPGANPAKSLKDMMQYHAKGFSSLQDKITQAKLFAEFILESLKSYSHPQAETLKAEAEKIANETSASEINKYLNENNKQFYFSDFMQQANENNLQYLADANLASMYLDNMPKNVADKLRALQNIISMEQYLDFITNRRVRHAMLTHADVKINREISPQDVKNFALQLNIIPEKNIDQVDLNNDEPANFYFQGNVNNSMTAKSPELKAILYVLANNRCYRLKFDTIIQKAKEYLTNPNLTRLDLELTQNAMMLVFKGYMTISQIETDMDKIDLTRPKITEYNRQMLLKQNVSWLVNNNHDVVTISDFERIALRHFDGRNIPGELAELLMVDFRRDLFTVTDNDGNKLTESDVQKQINLIIDETIKKCHSAALLV